MLLNSFGVRSRLILGCACLMLCLLVAAPAALTQQKKVPAAPSAQKLETAQQANERIRQLALAMGAHAGDSQIGSGDLVRIEVFDVPELSRELRVGESGYISLPLIPVKVKAAGLTSFQLEEKITELLQVNGLVSHPQVTVTIKEQRSQPITVIGAVQKPLVFQAVRRVTLLEILSEAGGISNDAGSEAIITRTIKPGPDAAEGARPEVQTIIIDLNELLQSGDPQYNVPVYGGDVITIPRAGIVYVVGAVERPGGFVLQNDREKLTAVKALALAGGLRSTAKPRNAVILRKDAGGAANKEIDVDLTQVLERKREDVLLQASDILYVPDSNAKRALRRVADVALALTTGLVLVRAGR